LRSALQLEDSVDLSSESSSISDVTEDVNQPLDEQLEELGAQLAWVREYL